MKQIQAKARVQVLVEIALSQPWGGLSTLNDVNTQGRRDAVDKLRAALACIDGQVTLKGEPKVISIITETD